MKLLISLVAALCLFAGCVDTKDKQYKIGVSQCSGGYFRDKTNDEMKRELLLHDDVEIEIRDADNDNDRQIADIQYFMDNGFDLIMVSPNETKPLTPAVQEVYAKGIPVVTFDRSIIGDSVTAHFEVDNYDLGKAVARYAHSIIPDKIKALEIKGPDVASPARLRHAGFTDVMSEYDNSDIVASVCGNWDDGRAEVLTDSLLQTHPEINLIFAHTDHMALGASRAAERAGRKDIVILGIDGFAPIGIKGVKDGHLTATFLYPTEGEQLLKLAISILKGQPYDKITKIPALSAIDKNNADIYLAQEALIDSETSKINLLQTKLSTFLERYSSQKTLLLALAIILILLAAFVFLLLKAINVHKRYQSELISKNRQLEEEKEKQQILYDKLQEATQSKLIFFTNVSHDLRTPLTLVAGPVEEVAEADYLSGRDRSLMQLARKNIRILRRLIDQILDFRKYENGKLNLNLSEINPADSLREWTDTFSETARKRNIRLSFKQQTEDNLTLAVDVEKMERVFFNLMSNALKHTTDNGKISVFCGNDSENVWFSVKDNGDGMTQEEMSKIFDRFYQADNIRPNGSGIGLALTKAFVELHNGEIKVESEKGVGSEFTVTVPIRHCDHTSEEPCRIAAADVDVELATPDRNDTIEYDTDKPLLLIIDDNTDVQKFVSDILGDEYNYIYAADGQRGVKMATKYVPDLIICDVMMPVLDGLECVKRLKDEISTSHIPVLMLTACSLDEQRVEGYDSGADGYLSKPFNGKVLEARCRNMLVNRKRIENLYGANGNVTGVLKSNAKEKPSGSKTPNDVESEFYAGFAKIVKERLSNPNLTIEEIASELCLSQSQLTRKIKALTNYTPVELIRNARLQHAGTLLKSTEKTISEIARECGFTSLAYFSKCYKDAYGQTPSEVRGR